MTYTFDWKDVVHGKIEIEAENGIEAERLFREMPLEQRLAASNVGVDKDTLDIKFVDVGFGDIQTPEEWEDTWKGIVWGVSDGLGLAHRLFHHLIFYW